MLTPHFNCENNPIKKADLIKRIGTLKTLVKKKKLDIRFYPGMEVKASHRIVEFARDMNYAKKIESIINRFKEYADELNESEQGSGDTD